MCTVCLLYVYRMRIVCLPYVYCMCICLLYVYRMCTVCLPYVYCMCTVCVPYVYCMCTVCVPYMYRMCTVCIPYVYRMCTVCVPGTMCAVCVLYVYSEVHTSVHLELSLKGRPRIILFTATHCNKCNRLQQITTHFSTMRNRVVLYSGSGSELIFENVCRNLKDLRDLRMSVVEVGATHRNTLQQMRHTATCCDTLRHTAAHLGSSQ